VISILKTGKDLALSSSFQPISLLDTTGKQSEKFLLTMILTEESGRGFLRNDLLGSDLNTPLHYC